MTDINKQIEEARECRQKLIQKIRLNKANIDYILENGSINGSLMLDIDKAMIDYHAHSSRWRKVSEELPEMGYRVLVRNEFKVSHLGYIDTVGDWRYCLNNELIKDKLLEWKPID